MRILFSTLIDSALCSIFTLFAWLAVAMVTMPLVNYHDTWQALFAIPFAVLAAEIVCPANARLIAAAPELYEQCKLFEKCLTYLINSGDSGADLERDNLRAILDKVDGGEK